MLKNCVYLNIWGSLNFQKFDKHWSTSLYIWSDWIQHKKVELVWSLIGSDWNNINTNEPPVELTTDVQTKVQKLEIRSPVLGLTVPLPNPFSGTGRESPLTNSQGARF